MTIVESALAARKPEPSTGICTMTYHVSIRRRRALLELLNKARDIRPDITWDETGMSPAASTFEISAPTELVRVINDHLRPIVREGADGVLYLD